MTHKTSDAKVSVFTKIAVRSPENFENAFP